MNAIFIAVIPERIQLNRHQYIIQNFSHYSITYLFRLSFQSTRRLFMEMENKRYWIACLQVLI